MAGASADAGAGAVQEEPLYRLEIVLDRVAAARRLEDSTVLREAMAELYTASGQFDQVLRLYLSQDQPVSAEGEGKEGLSAQVTPH